MPSICPISPGVSHSLIALIQYPIKDRHSPNGEERGSQNELIYLCHDTLPREDIQNVDQAKFTAHLLNEEGRG